MGISRRDFIVKTGLVGAFAAFGSTSKLFAFNQGTFTTIRRNVGIYSNRGGTIGWLVNSDASVVIDSQFADTAPDCIDGIQDMRTAQIDALINTHHHGDHTGGNGVFKPKVKNIIAHENVPILQRQQAQMRGDESIAGIPDTTYSDLWRRDFGDETIRLKYYGPAHTSGDSVITFEKANVVHMGDLVFNRVFPFIDRPGGANVKNWIKLLNGVLADHDSSTLYILGHGQPNLGMVSRMDALVHMRAYLEALVEHVDNGVSQGLSREEIVGIASLRGFEDHISFGPRLSLSSNLEVVYDELTSHLDQ